MTSAEIPNAPDPNSAAAAETAWLLISSRPGDAPHPCRRTAVAFPNPDPAPVTMPEVPSNRAATSLGFHSDSRRVRRRIDTEDQRYWNLDVVAAHLRAKGHLLGCPETQEAQALASSFVVGWSQLPHPSSSLAGLFVAHLRGGRGPCRQDFDLRDEISEAFAGLTAERLVASFPWVGLTDRYNTTVGLKKGSLCARLRATAALLPDGRGAYVFWPALESLGRRIRPPPRSVWTVRGPAHISVTVKSS